MGRRPTEPPIRREELILLRVMAGETQQSLAEALHVDPSTVGAWESGRRAPSAPLWPALAAALGISVAELARILGHAVPIELRGHVVPRNMSHYDSLILTAGRIDMFERCRTRRVGTAMSPPNACASRENDPACADYDSTFRLRHEKSS